MIILKKKEGRKTINKQRKQKKKGKKGMKKKQLQQPTRLLGSV